MKKKELYLKTLFCCSACDGSIAPEEIALVKEKAINSSLFEDFDVEANLNLYVKEINQQGSKFLKNYLSDISGAELLQEEQMSIIKLAIEMIDADEVIEYSEIKFFKQIRKRLTVDDDTILKQHPDKEDYLLPDLKGFDFNNLDDIRFEEINFDIKTIS